MAEKKEEIYELAKEYIQEYYAEDLPEFEKTWMLYDEQGLFAQEKLFLDYPEDTATVSISGEEIDLVISAVVIGIATNAIYDLMKLSLVEIGKYLKRPRKRKRLLRGMGILHEAVQDMADAFLVWTLKKIETKKKKKKD